MIGIDQPETTLYYGDYEWVEENSSEDNLYSFKSNFYSTYSSSPFYDGVVFPLQNDDINGYFVLSADLKTLYFLTEEGQWTSGDYSADTACAYG